MNTESENSNSETGFWNWGKGLAFVVGLFVITTLGVVFYLVSLDYYMVSENHYKEAVEYQQQIDRIEHTRALDRSVEISQNQGQGIMLQFPDSLAVLNPVGSVQLYRPSDAGLDQSFELTIDKQGHQYIPAGDLQKGKWVIRVSWEIGKKGFFEEKSIFLQ